MVDFHYSDLPGGGREPSWVHYVSSDHQKQAVENILAFSIHLHENEAYASILKNVRILDDAHLLQDENRTLLTDLDTEFTRLQSQCGLIRENFPKHMKRPTKQVLQVFADVAEKLGEYRLQLENVCKNAGKTAPGPDESPGAFDAGDTLNRLGNLIEATKHLRNMLFNYNCALQKEK